MQYNINIRNSICPKCAGLLIPTRKDWKESLIYHCLDCKTVYHVVGMGQADSEFILESKEEK